MAENENVTAKKPRVRPIVRLGIFLISHSNYVSLICFVSGIVALLLLPILAKNTYVSENALMPGYTLSVTFPKSLLFLFFYLLDMVTVSINWSINHFPFK
ncbi:glycosylphosphatidylinositol anchor attachment 1 [Trifolium pratense]|uniref:Glycosylphosphatidylinositol anchor attachment 1 n=1 Tax=Trifolium pratense TaxID=57577 RepID=A0A2K3JT67_TRIPR|nr:glycosylphosphatidylinositol anchor attachment 1 [Trifolium pratense]